MTTATPSLPTRLRGALPEILRFGLVGLLNTATTLAIIWTLMFAGLSPYLANFVGYGAGMTVSFVLNRNWTFRRRSPTRPVEIFHFLLASGASYLLNLATVAALLRTGFPPYPAQLAGMPVYTVSFFLLSKFFVFNAPKPAEETP